MQQLTLIQEICILIIPVLFAITGHEAAHGWVAHKLGDNTAKKLGRLTFNPIRHLDPVGSVIVPLFTCIFTGLTFGWAKPVPINYHNLKNPKRDMALIAAAGPLANLLMAIFWALAIKLAQIIASIIGVNQFDVAIAYMGMAGVGFNLLILVINLLPIPPLDGSRIFILILPAKIARYYAMIAPFGFLIILLLLVTHALTGLLQPLTSILQNTLNYLFLQ